MIFLICVSALVLLILFLLLLPVRLSASYDGTLSIYVRYLFYKHVFYPEDETVRLSDYTPRKVRKKRKKAKKRRQLEARLSEEQRELLRQKEAKEQQEDEDKLKKVIRYLRLFLYVMRNTYRRIRVRKFVVTVATDDAARTAILYGVTSQAVAYLLAITQTYIKYSVDEDAVNVVADFCGTTPSADISLLFSTTPLHLLLLAIRNVMKAAKEEKEAAETTETTDTKRTTDKTDTNTNGENENERKQSE